MNMIARLKEAADISRIINDLNCCDHQFSLICKYTKKNNCIGSRHHAKEVFVGQSPYNRSKPFPPLFSGSSLSTQFKDRSWLRNPTRKGSTPDFEIPLVHTISAASGFGFKKKFTIVDDSNVIFIDYECIKTLREIDKSNLLVLCWVGRIRTAFWILCPLSLQDYSTVSNLIMGLPPLHYAS